MNTLRVIAMVTALTAAATVVSAQQNQMPVNPGMRAEARIGPDDDVEQGPDRAVSEEKREEIRRKVESFRIWKLIEELKLDAGTSAKMSSLLSSLDQKRKEIQQQQMAAMRELRAILKKTKPDESKIKSLLDKLEGNLRAMQELRDREWNSIKEFLSPEQQARFFLFQQRFQREMRGMIDGARGRGPGEGGRGIGSGQSMKRDRRPAEQAD